MIEETRAQLIEWLKQMNVSEEQIHTMSEEEINKSPLSIRAILEGMIIVPYKLTIEGSEEEILLSVKIMMDDEWIQIKLYLMKGDMPDHIKLQLYDHLLKANFNMNEVTFSVAPNDDIFVEADMPVGISFKNFESEYSSVLYGADFFLFDILPELQEQIIPQTTYQPQAPNFFI